MKWFEMVHFGLPMCALAALFAPVRLTERSVSIFNFVQKLLNVSD